VPEQDPSAARVPAISTHVDVDIERAISKMTQRDLEAFERTDTFKRLDERINGERTLSRLTVSGALDLVNLELLQAMGSWPPFNSAHEGWGVLKEEVKELTDHVFMKQSKRDLNAMRREAIQVAAMAVRFALEVCDEERGRK
jgi:hypothetical protein